MPNRPAKKIEHHRLKAIQLFQNPVFGSLVITGAWPEDPTPGIAGILPVKLRV